MRIAKAGDFIGEFEVKGIAPNAVKVGCTTVTREQIESLLNAMNEAPKGLTVGEYGTQKERAVFLRQGDDGNVLLYIRADGYDYQVLALGPDGITPIKGCGTQAHGMPFDDNDGSIMVNAPSSDFYIAE